MSNAIKKCEKALNDYLEQKKGDVQQVEEKKVEEKKVTEDKQVEQKQDK